MQYIVESDSAGERLDRYLAARLPELSRSWIQRSIKKGEVVVNGKKISPHHFLKKDDQIDVSVVSRPPINLDPDPEVAVEVIAETPDYLIINKAPGIVVHPAEGVPSHTVVNGLLARYPELRGVGEHPWRPGIVHRLDRDASGLMIVARNAAAFEYYKAQFKSRQIRKEYIALVYGEALPPSGTVTFSILRSEKGRMASVPEGQTGSRAARTDYEVVRRFHHCTLVNARTLTGRTHQVRVHFHGIGHPLVGDSLYRISQFASAPQAAQLFLCAHRLAFTDQNGIERVYEISIPEGWKEFMEKLKGLD